MTATTRVYANATMAVEDRVADLLAGMEVDEELAQLGAVGFPDLMKGERLDEEAALAVVAWPLGEQGGAALADVLLGRAEPTGRLAVTLLRATGQVPLYNSHRSGGAGSVFYEDHPDYPHTPLFSFGHGRGYTSFAYTDPKVRANDTSSPVGVAVTVANTGMRPGEEVVQLYSSDLVASVARFIGGGVGSGARLVRRSRGGR